MQINQTFSNTKGGSSNKKYHDNLKSDVEGFENTLTEKLKDLQINFTVNEKHIDSLKDEFQVVVERLQIDEVEENQSYQEQNENLLK